MNELIKPISHFIISKTVVSYHIAQLQHKTFEVSYLNSFEL